MKYGNMPGEYMVMNARTYRHLSQYEVLAIRMNFAENQRILLSSLMIVIYVATLLLNLRLQSTLAGLASSE